MSSSLTPTSESGFYYVPQLLSRFQQFSSRIEMRALSLRVRAALAIGLVATEGIGEWKSTREVMLAVFERIAVEMTFFSSVEASSNTTLMVFPPIKAKTAWTCGVLRLTGAPFGNAA